MQPFNTMTVHIELYNLGPNRSIFIYKYEGLSLIIINFVKIILPKRNKISELQFVYVIFMNMKTKTWWRALCRCNSFLLHENLGSTQAKGGGDCEIWFWSVTRVRLTELIAPIYKLNTHIFTAH